MLHKILLEWSNQGEWDRWGIQHTWERWEMHTQFESENLKGRALRRAWCRWEDSSIMDLRETGWRKCGLHVSDSGYGSVAGCCEHSNERLGSIKGD